MRYMLTIFLTPLIVLAWGITMSWEAVKGSMRMLRLVRKWRDKDKPTHGDAHFADDKFLKRKGYFKPEGFFAGVSEKGRRIYTKPERNALMMAHPGAGKSQHFIAAIRAVLERPAEKLPFMLVGDADGEIYEATAKLFASAGYNIARIDAVQPEDWSRYDVLAELDPTDEDRYDRALDAFCRLIITEEAGSKQPHFVDFARLLLKCVITVNVKYENNDKPINELIGELINSTKREELFKRSKKYGDDYVTAALDTMGKMEGKPEGLSMMSSSLRKLEGWNNAAVRKITSYGPDLQGSYTRGWNFDKFLRQEQPAVLFLRTGIEQSGGDLSRVVYGNAINAVANIRNITRQPLTRELEIFMDEGGLTGYCNAIENAYSRQRKSGVRLRMCFLSLKEFKDTYPSADTIINGCDLVVFGGGKDDDLARKVSDLIGDFTVESRSRSESDQGESKGVNEQPRRLIKPDEIRRLGEEEALLLLDNIVVRGRKPWKKVKSKKRTIIKYL